LNPHALTVSPGTPPGNYRLIAGLYVADRNLPRLPVTYPPGTIDDAVVLGEVKVEK
jgi:hypothetical protein